METVFVLKVKVILLPEALELDRHLQVNVKFLQRCSRNILRVSKCQLYLIRL